MKKTFLLFCSMAISLSSALAEVFKTNVLYKCDFSEATTSNSYIAGEPISLNGTSWNVNSYKCTSDGFFLGGNSTSTYNIDNYADLKKAWENEDSKASDCSQVFAAQLDKEYTNVHKLIFNWNGVGGSGAVQVYLFVDCGEGFEFVEHVSTNSEGSLSKTFAELTTVKRVAIVSRPGATNSVAKGRQLKLTTFEIDGDPISVTEIGKPTFSLNPEMPVWEGSMLTISNDEGIENTKIVYTINGSAKNIGDNPANIAINETSEIEAYCAVEGATSSEPTSVTYTVFDLNGDFENWENGLPTNWSSGSIAKSNVKLSVDETYITLTQTTKEAKRFATDEFYLEAGEYNFSALYRYSENAKPISFEYVLNGANFGSAKEIGQGESTAADFKEFSGTFTLENASTIKLAIKLEKKETSSENWSIDVKNVKFSSTTEPLSINVAEKQTADVKVKGNTIEVKCEKGNNVKVFNMQGQCLQSEIANDEFVTLTGFAKGEMLIIQVDQKIAKVVLK